MVIKSRLFKNWDPNTKRNLRRATSISGTLRDFTKRFPNSRTFVVFNKKQVMGWAFAYKKRDAVNLFLFVNRRYRGKGLSKVLVESSLKFFPSIRLAVHDEVTKKVFRKLADELNGKVVTYNWWKEYYSMIDGL